MSGVKNLIQSRSKGMGPNGIPTNEQYREVGLAGEAESAKEDKSEGTEE